MSITIEPRRSGVAPAVAPDAAQLAGRPAGEGLAGAPEPTPALLLEHVSKAFIVGRR